jgi:hypothetical protein
MIKFHHFAFVALLHARINTLRNRTNNNNKIIIYVTVVYLGAIYTTFKFRSSAPRHHQQITSNISFRRILSTRYLPNLTVENSQKYARPLRRRRTTGAIAPLKACKSPENSPLVR